MMMMIWQQTVATASTSDRLGMFQSTSDRLGMFQSVVKTIKLDALPDGGRKLHDEILFLAESLRQLDIHISHSKAAQTGTS